MEKKWEWLDAAMAINILQDITIYFDALNFCTDNDLNQLGTGLWSGGMSDATTKKDIRHSVRMRLGPIPQELIF